MHKVKSMLLTVLCMGMILGLGYLLIMESGRKVLENGVMLEETDYDSTSSNIFYGKIEEDIELFPWNYYPGEEAEMGWESETGIHPMFQYSILTGTAEMEEEELKALQSWYLCQMIAFKTGNEPSEVWNLFDKKNHTLMDEIRIVENSPIGPLFFYQDTLTLGEKQYQVRISFTQWNVISFICMENREENVQESSEAQAVGQVQEGVVEQPSDEDSQAQGEEPSDEIQEGSAGQLGSGDPTDSGKRKMSMAMQSGKADRVHPSGGNHWEDMENWKKGKEKLVKILEESQKQMAEYFDYMCFLRDWDDTTFYVDDEYANCYLESLQWLERIQKGEDYEDYELSNILGNIWEIKKSQNIYTDEPAYDSEYKAEDTLSKDSYPIESDLKETVNEASGEVEYSTQTEPEVEADLNFSYQIVDLKDMILLLMQGESTLGIFYDPIVQEFCGYNFFYEY